MSKQIHRNKENAISRIYKMNEEVEKLKDEPFSKNNEFYHVHGHHKDRAKLKGTY